MIAPQSIDSALLLNCPSKGQWGSIVGAMKPGAHLLLFSDVKNHHLGTIEAEDNRLEIRDTIAYVFADGENNVGMMLVTLARKPLDGTVAENTLRWGTGGINIDRCRIGVDLSDPNHRVPCSGNSGANSIFGVGGHDGNLKPEGRWPANLTLESCLSVKEMFPYTASNSGKPFNRRDEVRAATFGTLKGVPASGYYGDERSASRFFYSTPPVTVPMKNYITCSAT